MTRLEEIGVSFVLVHFHCEALIIAIIGGKYEYDIPTLIGNL